MDDAYASSRTHMRPPFHEKEILFAQNIEVNLRLLGVDLLVP